MRTLLVALLLSAVAAAQSFDELLPDSTILYISIENVARTKERYEKSPLAALWKDEAMQAFLARPKAKWAELMEEMRKDAGVTPSDVIDLLAGQVAIGVSWPEGAKEPVPLLLADIGDNGDKLREILDKEEKKLVDEKGLKRNEEEFRGAKIVSYAKGGESGAADEGSAWCLDGKTFAFGENADVLKDMLARREHKDEGTLAARALYQRLRGRTGARAGDVFAYVDGPNFFKALKDTGELDEDGMRILGALGVSAIEGLGLEGSLEPGGIVVRLFLGVKGQKAGLLKLFDGKNTALLPPRYAPGDTLSGGAWALDVPALWEEGRRVADDIEKGTTGLLDTRLGFIKQQTGVDIQADLIASLGAEISFLTRPPEKPDPAMAANPMAMMLAGGRFAVGLQLKDRERFEGAVDKLLALAGPSVSTTDYLGVKLRTMQAPGGMQPAMAVLPDRFVFAMSADDLKDVIARYGKETKGFLDREEVAKAIASLPPQRFYVSVEDVPKALSQQMSTISSTMGMLGGGSEMNDYIDFSLFPSAEVLAKYLGLNSSCLVNEEDGVTYLSVLHLNG